MEDLLLPPPFAGDNTDAYDIDASDSSPTIDEKWVWLELVECIWQDGFGPLV